MKTKLYLILSILFLFNGISHCGWYDNIKKQCTDFGAGFSQSSFSALKYIMAPAVGGLMLGSVATRIKGQGSEKLLETGGISLGLLSIGVFAKKFNQTFPKNDDSTAKKLGNYAAKLSAATLVIGAMVGAVHKT